MTLLCENTGILITIVQNQYLVTGVPLSIEWTHKTEKIILHNGTYVRIDWACDTLWMSGSFFHYRNM